MSAPTPAPSASTTSRTAPGRRTVAAVEFVLLLGFWFLLSGRFSWLFVTFGLASAAAMTLVTHRTLGDALGPHVGGLAATPRRAWRWASYIAWLLTRIPPAALDVARHTLRPTPTCDPHVLELTTHLASPVARALLANSISVVPGTITLDVDGQRFTVHAFTPGAADALVSAEVQNRIAHVFGQEPEPAPEVRWDPRTAGEDER